MVNVYNYPSLFILKSYFASGTARSSEQWRQITKCPMVLQTQKLRKDMCWKSLTFRQTCSHLLAGSGKTKVAFTRKVLNTSPLHNIMPRYVYEECSSWFMEETKRLTHREILGSLLCLWWNRHFMGRRILCPNFRREMTFILYHLSSKESIKDTEIVMKSGKWKNSRLYTVTV